VRKYYILDTSTIIYDPECFKVFRGNNVIIPIVVLEELDKIKTRTNFAGANSRKAIRIIDNYFKECPTPKKGVDIENNVVLFIDVSMENDERFTRNENDDRIISCAARYRDSILVSKDIAMRLRAKSFEINSQDYINDKIILEANDMYTGYRDIELTEYYEGFTDLGLDDCTGTVFESLFPNECVQVTSNGTKRIYRKNSDGELKPIIQKKKDIFKIKSKNKEQAYALDLLLDKNVPLVSLVGRSGSGKTLLSVAAALEMVLEDNAYDRIEIYRPIVSVGHELGHLPGALNEKLDPWYGAIKNALEFVMPKNVGLEEFMYLNKNKIRFEAISYIRGKSLNNTIILIDEAQNLTKQELKAIITRSGYNSKVILNGDIYQSDNIYMDALSNGLSYVVEKFKTSKLSGHVLLMKGERSSLATEASMIL